MKNIKTIILASLLLAPMATVYSQKKVVMTMDIKNEIDPRMTHYVALAFKHAEKIKADIVIIEMNTYGGVLTDAKDIVDKIMAFKKPVWVYVNTNAASAGALISIACDSIYMSPGASIGAATVVNSSGEKAPDKYQSYMRSIMRSTAEENKRDPRIAEGMVDEEVEVDSIKQAGKIITFSTAEAIKYGYCEGKVESIAAILQKNHVDYTTINHFEPSAVDSIVNFFLNPFISGILILIIIGGIYFEFQAPGIGFPLFAAITALVLYLVPYYLNGLAANWEIIAFFTGILLLGVEIFVIPGFGVAGVAGIALTLCSLVLIMINNEAFDFEFVRMNDILVAATSALAGLMAGVALLFFGSARLANTKAFMRMALTDTQDRAKGYTANFNKEPMKGKRGVAHTVLRPSGRVMIEGQLYDAFTKNGYLEKGTPVEVIDQEGSTIRVKEVV